jgi:hypothetical protein
MRGNGHPALDGWVGRIGGDLLSNRESLKTWAAIAALLIFAGLASALVPFLVDQAEGASGAQVTREPAETTVDVSQLPFVGEVLVDVPFIADNIQGRPITMLQAFGIAFGAVLIGVGALALPITLLILLFDRFVKRVYEDDEYQQASAALQQREKEFVKALQEDKPTTQPRDKKERSRWSLGVYAFIFLLLVWITGLTLGAVYLADTEVNILGLSLSGTAALNLGLGLLTIVVLLLWLRRRSLDDLENPASDNNPVNWGYIWLVVSGALIVGIGAGAALAVRGG